MKKNKKAKENFDNVVINRVELTPTTIGKIDANENSFGGVIALFATLIIIIFVLPYVVNFINSFQNNEAPTVITPPVEEPSQKPEEPEIPEEPEVKEDFLNANAPVSKTISGFRYDIEVNSSTNNVKVLVTNVSGSAKTLINTPMYIELYTSDKTLLDRILITKEEIASDTTKEYSYSFKDNTGTNASPTYLTINSKSINDYPAITLKTEDINNFPFLTCIKGDETLVYTFQNDNDYLLTKINYQLRVSKNDETTLNTYEAKTASYKSIKGVDADIVPKTTGFTFEATIDLGSVNISERQKILDNKAFYEKDTFAKTIYFELSSSGYNCN